MINKICLLSLLLLSFSSFSQNAKLYLQSVEKVNFSSNITKDEFKIVITGVSLQKGECQFTIVNAKQDTLWNEVFPAIQLLGFNDTIPEKFDDAITDRINYFFYESFENPAIPESEQFSDGNFAPKEHWEQISNQKNTTGFTYLIGKANMRSLAYCKILRKVVIYRMCC